jgi:hypothetical protein
MELQVLVTRESQRGEMKSGQYPPLSPPGGGGGEREQGYTRVLTRRVLVMTYALCMLSINASS